MGVKGADWGFEGLILNVANSPHLKLTLTPAINELCSKMELITSNL